MKIIILDSFAVNPGDMDWNFLGQYGEFTVYDSSAPDTCAKRIGDAEAVFVNRAKLDGNILSDCPLLRFIGTLGTGYDMIDLAYCRENNIAVANVPAYSSDSVAQLTFTLLLNLTTDMNGLKNIVHRGYWTGVPNFEYQKIKYTELCGMNLGLIGCGGIGHRVAEMANAFKINVFASTASKTSGTDSFITYLPMDEMLGISDIISIHCPLNDRTRGMVNSTFISKMKRGAYLINTARGAILNEQDMAQALFSGRLAGAGLDVLADEPAKSENPLLSAPNCIITPHVGWTSYAARRRLLIAVEKNLAAYINGVSLNRIV